MASKKLLASPSIRRLPTYLNIIKKEKLKGNIYISGTVIALELNVEPIQVRKDLAITKVVGKPKKGYIIDELISAIEMFLGWNKMRNAVLIGAGNLGSALLGFSDFSEHGLNFVAAFDTNPEKKGTTIHSVPVYLLESLKDITTQFNVRTAILTVPAKEAQTIADTIINAGIIAIWNFTNVKLKVPDHVIVQKEDLTSGWAMLCAHMQRSESGSLNG